MVKKRRQLVICYWIGYLPFIAFYLYEHSIIRYKNSEITKARVIQLAEAGVWKKLIIILNLNFYTSETLFI
jgi:hypothetical protein